MFDAQELKERIAALGDDELLRMVHEEADQYRPEALEVARQEIVNRGLEVELDDTSHDALQTGAVEEEEELELGPHSLLCPACGSRLRPALLLGETQVIAVFEDNHEQRFVRAFVCPRCGTADLFVDFETDVQE